MNIIEWEGNIIAIVIPSNYNNSGIKFFTPDSFSQQLAYMNRPKNYEIEPHVHRKVKREVVLTQEVLFIKSGKLQVDLYTDKKNFITQLILTEGDVILLASGGHGFKMLEDTEMIEVKQGPFSGDRDKERFTPNTNNE